MFQEDCAGRGMLTTAMRMFGLPAQRRDVPCMHGFGLHCHFKVHSEILYSRCFDLLSTIGFMAALSFLR